MASEQTAGTISEAAFLAALKPFEDPTAVPESVDLCGTYKQIKPVLQGILPFLRFIPQIGAPAATAIQALLTVLDGVCPAS